jgi:hypothetical protein
MSLLSYTCVAMVTFVNVSHVQIKNNAIPNAFAYAPPEVKKGNWSVLKEYTSYFPSLRMPH